MLTIEDIIKKYPIRIPVREAGEILGISPRFLQAGLKQKCFDFGTAVKLKEWAYYINTKRFINYIEARDGKSQLENKPI